MDSKMIYHLFVKCKPAAQPRTRKGKYGNIYNPGTADVWKEAIQASFLLAGARRKDTISGPVVLEMKFLFYVSEKCRKASPHTTKPDIDNLVKSVMDALKGIEIYKDDCRVCGIYAQKFWTNEKDGEGMYIKVSRVENECK